MRQNMMNFVLKTRNFVSKTMNLASKMMNCVLKMMNFAGDGRAEGVCARSADAGGT